MIRLLLLILSFCFAILSYGQTVNDIPIKDIAVEYVQIVGTAKLLSSKMKIDIDFGQRDKLFKTKDTQIKDKAGKALVLNSMIDALNFMVENGYEFVQAYAVVIANQNVYHYLLRKQKE